MNCKELVYLLGEYFDGTMEHQLRQELDSHIAKCEPCVNFLRTYDKTRAICRQIQPEEIPEALKTRLKAFVLEKAREHHRDIEKYIARAAQEQKREVMELIAAFAADRLSPTLHVICESHRGRCPVCGSFLQTVKAGDGSQVPLPPPDVQEHIADFLDALPPGERPIIRA